MNRRMGRQLGIAVLLWVAGGLVGCGGTKKKGPPPKQDFKIEVEVTNKKKSPVPEAPVLVDGKRVGYTDRDGRFVATLRERPGKKVDLAIGEMEGYRFVSKHETTEKLKVRKSVTGKGFHAVGIPFSVKVTSTTEPHLVWVKTFCDEETLDEKACRGLPVKRNGEIVARTDHTGRAHFSFEEDPQTKISVTIDTPPPPEGEDAEESEAPTFEPADPSFEIELALDPKVYVIEQRFDDPTVDTWDPPPGYYDDDDDSEETTASAGGGSSGSTGSNAAPSGGGGGSAGGSAQGSGSSGGSDSSGSGKDDGPIKLFD